MTSDVDFTFEQLIKYRAIAIITDGFRRAELVSLLPFAEVRRASFMLLLMHVIASVLV